MGNIRNNKGITLIELAIYLIIILFVIGILTTIRSFFYTNLDVVKDTSRYAAYFDKINSFIVNDVKNNSKVEISSGDGAIITFEDGTIYNYISETQSLYRGNVKIAENVKVFVPMAKKVVNNNFEKEILNIEIVLGTSGKNIFMKKIDYTLKYW